MATNISGEDNLYVDVYINDTGDLVFAHAERIVRTGERRWLTELGITSELVIYY